MKKSNPNISTIDEGQGLGVLKFGFDRKAVELILGKPDEIEDYSYQSDEEDLTENWHYDELDVSLGFDEEDDWKLTTISITSSNYIFKGIPLLGLSKEALKNELKAKGIIDLEYENLSSEELPTHELLSSDSLCINFWFDEDQVSEVQWGPLFIDDETIDWPV